MRKIAISTNDAPKPVGTILKRKHKKFYIHIRPYLTEPKTGKICSSEFREPIKPSFQKISPLFAKEVGTHLMT